MRAGSVPATSVRAGEPRLNPVEDEVEPRLELAGERVPRHEDHPSPSHPSSWRTCSPARTGSWDERALAAYELVREDDLRPIGIDSARGFAPSLHLNLGDGYPQFLAGLDLLLSGLHRRLDTHRSADRHGRARGSPAGHRPAPGQPGRLSRGRVGDLRRRADDVARSGRPPPPDPHPGLTPAHGSSASAE